MAGPTGRPGSAAPVPPTERRTNRQYPWPAGPQPQADQPWRQSGARRFPCARLPDEETASSASFGECPQAGTEILVEPGALSTGPAAVEQAHEIRIVESVRPDAGTSE